MARVQRSMLLALVLLAAIIYYASQRSSAQSLSSGAALSSMVPASDVLTTTSSSESQYSPDADPLPPPPPSPSPPPQSPSDARILVSPPVVDDPTIPEPHLDPWHFLRDQKTYGNANWDAPALARHRPHHWRGPGRPTFATYLSTRNGTLQNPYFLAAQQLVYRVLWHPPSRSAQYPFTVFVAPHIPYDQRDILAAAGAIVQELPLIAWPRDDMEPLLRWQDLFSKLHMWNQTQYSKIAFLDVDAFPLTNIDDLLDDASAASSSSDGEKVVIPMQTCRPELLPPEDQARAAEICEYTFAGCAVDYGVAEAGREINVGVVVFNPNRAMHARLLREMASRGYNAGMAEQAFLTYMYSAESPFPASGFGREYNGFLPQDDDEGRLKVIHEKIWSEPMMRGTPWTLDLFPAAWRLMLALYESEEFARARARDDLLASAGQDITSELKPGAAVVA